MSNGLNTSCLHLEDEDITSEHYGAISYPIYQTATYVHPGVGRSTGYDYSRLQNPTRERLEKVIAGLEGGIDAFALSSGMAAITLLMEIFHPGDHIIVEADLYGGSIRLFDNVSVKNDIEITYLNCSEDDIALKIRENTKAIYIETPTNPMMSVSDIEAISKIAKENGLILIVDNTFLSPYFQNPIKLGADVVIHSGTKFIGGHNDTLAGFIVTDNEEIREKLRFLIILRGVKTLGIRMERAQKNALKIAEWLSEQDIVKNVYYPGLPKHPGHDLIKRQARGFGSMITFDVDSKQHALEILEKVRIIKFAESLGGVETLITYPTTQTHADVPEEVRLRNGITDRTLRLSVGIEDIEDLLRELTEVFSSLKEENDA